MLLPGKKKLELSDEYKQEQRYKELNGSEKIIWYKKLKNSNIFDDFKNWKISFEEDFTSKKLVLLKCLDFHSKNVSVSCLYRPIFKK